MGEQQDRRCTAYSSRHHRRDNYAGGSRNNKGFQSAGPSLYAVLEVLAPGAQPATLHQDTRGLPTPESVSPSAPRWA